MDFGLSGITKALNLPTLGKRGSALENVTEVRTFQDEQNVKRGRFDRSSTNKDDISGGGGPPLPEAMKLLIFL